MIIKDSKPGILILNFPVVTRNYSCETLAQNNLGNAEREKKLMLEVETKTKQNYKSN